MWESLKNVSDPGTQAGLWLGASCSLKKMQAELPLLGLTKLGIQTKLS